MKVRSKKKEEEIPEIVCIIDKSGSMSGIKNDAIGGFNSFLEEQKKIDGKANMTIVFFSGDYHLSSNGEDLHSIEPLTDKTYIPGGVTALLDAIGKTLEILDYRKVKKALIAILTDGEENASTDFTRDKIFRMISDRKERGFQFAFLAANQDAIQSGTSISIPKPWIYTWESTPKGTIEAYNIFSSCSTNYRTGGANDSKA